MYEYTQCWDKDCRIYAYVAANCLFMNDGNALLLSPKMGFPLGLGGPPSPPRAQGNLGYVLCAIFRQEGIWV